MPLSEAKYKANTRYIKKAYEKIAFNVRRDAEINGDYIRSHAKAIGESMNGFIKRAVKEAIERDNAKAQPPPMQ